VLKRRLTFGFAAVAVILIAVLWWESRVNLSALEEPGLLETWAATTAKRRLIARAAEEVPPRPARDGAAVAMGGMQFRADCAACHGSDGRTPTDIGKWMSPRAPDLSSPEVQAWSDAELFWIIKHGVKMTGMPGFGRVHPDERIWHLVFYVREMGKKSSNP